MTFTHPPFHFYSGILFFIDFERTRHGKINQKILAGVRAANNGSLHNRLYRPVCLRHLAFILQIHNRCVVNGEVDTTFLHSLWYTALFTVVTVAIINVVAFGIAMALTKGIKGTNLFRTVFFLPNLIGGIVLSYVWLMIFNSYLAKYSKTIVSTQWYAFWGLVIVVCWQQIGYMMIIYVAGIQNIPADLIEAAKIDGANNWQLLKNVTLPLLMPTITICSFLTLTNGFKLFDQNLALTGGNPGKMSELLALNIYNTMYGTTGWQGVGQAKAVIFFLLVALISVIQNKLTTSKEVQQ